MKKRLLSGFLAVVIIATLFPVTVYAVDVMFEDTLENNQDEVIDNFGTVTSNDGQVVFNFGTVTNNYGKVVLKKKNSD